MSWEELSTLVAEIWQGYNTEPNQKTRMKIKEQIREIAPDSTYAAWNLQDWDRFKKYTK